MGMDILYEVQGSNALQEAYVQEAQEEEAILEVPKQQEEPHRRPRKRGLTGQKKAAIMGVIFALSAMALVIQMLMANLNTNYRILSEKKRELNNVEAQVEQLYSETEGASVVAVTEEEAAELGLYKVNRDQVVYISLDDEDSGRVLAEDNSNVGIRAFLNKVAAIAEYFY